MTIKSFSNTEITGYNLFELLIEEKVEYIYRGAFDTKITDGILSLAEVNLGDKENSRKLRKRVFFILVEGLQNVTRHQDKVSIEDAYNEGFLVIQNKKDGYVITTGNLVNNNDIPKLRENLDKVNSLSNQELKDYYRKILDNDTFSSKGGAGLGLIEIARKSGNKLGYNFQTISEQHSYFYMQTRVTYTPNSSDFCNIKSMNNIKSIHKYILSNDIFLNVTGIFNYDKLVYLISILEGHVTRQAVVKNKMFSLMIELMQNVVKHAEDIEIQGKSGKFSFFYITTNDREISLNSGNFIKNSKTKELKFHLEKINNMNQAELNKFHFDTLLDYKTNKSMLYGIGMLDMRIKSRNLLDYSFQEIDEDYSFITLKVRLNQESSRIRVLEIAVSSTTPRIILDEKNGKFTFCGDSYPEDALGFYEPVMSWLEGYAKNPRLFSLFEFKFRFLSTNSQKELIPLFKILEKISKTSTVVVKWGFMKNNEDSLNLGVEFSKLFNLDFNFFEFDELLCE